MSYDEFKPLVDLVLKNWTALQLAIDHGMGSSGDKTGQIMSDYVARYCVENVQDIDNLTEVLEDIMDEEFDTVCEDNSPKEVATILLHYFTLLKEGRRDELQARVAAMPVCQKSLSQKVFQPQNHGGLDEDSGSSSEEDEINNTHTNGALPASVPTHNTEPEPMDEDVDPGWTVVRTRRKK